MAIDSVIIGAGPAGLAASAALTERGIEHLVLDRGDAGQTWRRQRWDSFRLNTPGWMNAILPEQSRHAYAAREEVIERLDELGAAAPLRRATPVENLSPDGGEFNVTVPDGVIRARSVVVATGDQNVPVLPAAARDVKGDITQCHAARYRSADQLPPGRVLVVGSGQSGCQIAHDLLTAGRDVILSTCAVPRMPARHRGRETFEWLVAAGFYEQRPEDLPDPSIVFLAQPVILAAGRSLSLQMLARDGVTLAGRLRSVEGARVEFDDTTSRNIGFGDEFAERFRKIAEEFISREGIDAPPVEPDDADEIVVTRPLRALDLRAEEVTSLIWCTGFTGDFRWLADALRGPDGKPLHVGLDSPVPGVWFIGMKWLARRASGILYGFPGDAARVADSVAASLHTRRNA